MAETRYVIIPKANFMSEVFVSESPEAALRLFSKFAGSDMSVYFEAVPEKDLNKTTHKEVSR